MLELLFVISVPFLSSSVLLSTHRLGSGWQWLVRSSLHVLSHSSCMLLPSWPTLGSNQKNAASALQLAHWVCEIINNNCVTIKIHDSSCMCILLANLFGIVVSQLIAPEVVKTTTDLPTLVRLCCTPYS